MSGAKRLITSGIVLKIFLASANILFTLLLTTLIALSLWALVVILALNDVRTIAFFILHN